MASTIEEIDRNVDEQDRQALEAFVIDNADLELLEGIIDQFNIFESIGMVRQELRHSDFLAFLIDPRHNHRLGDIFTRRFLQKALVAARPLDAPVSPVHLDAWDLGRLTVRREWHNIDLLLVDPGNHFVVLIENKIDSGEHSGQLGRYLRLVRNEYPAPIWRIVAFYLTPGGDAPSEPDFLPVSYGIVSEAVEAVAESRKTVVGPAVHTLMIHYASMLRRHVVTDSQTADLCRQIYARHQRALDLIFEHRPDRLTEIRHILVDVLESTPGLVMDTFDKRKLRFGSAAWEDFPRGSGWTKSGRILLFQLDIFEQSLGLELWIGPGPLNVRQRFIEAARGREPLLGFGKKIPEAEQWSSIFKRNFLKPEDYETYSREEIAEQIRVRWSQFVNEELPPLIEAMQLDAPGPAPASGAGVAPR